MSHIFVSYAHADEDYVLKLVEHTTRKGFNVWHDRKIEPGDRWWKSITQAIRDCSALIAVMTPEAEDSEWVEKEIILAVKEKKAILPILLRGNVFPLLNTVQYYDASEREHFNYLPPPEFYIKLKKSAPSAWNELLTQQDRAKVIEKRSGFKLNPETDYEPENPVSEDPTIYATICEWSRFVRENPSDFYGLAMLAISYEAEGSRASHIDAMLRLKKACMIEPRVKSKKWMSENFNWGEEQHTQLEQILRDL